MNYLLPAAKQLFLEVNPKPDETTATRTQKEKEFFSSVRLSNGVFKTTSSLRLDDVNKTLIALFQKLGVAPKTFLDVAVSSGISTIEWFESLQHARLKPSMTATDLTMTAYLVRLCSWCNVLVDKEGFPLQYECWGFALRPWSPKRYYVLGDWCLTLLYRTLYRRFGKRLGLLNRLKSLEGNPPPTNDPVIKARVQLVTWRLRDNNNIELLDDDITQPTPPAPEPRPLAEGLTLLDALLKCRTVWGVMVRETSGGTAGFGLDDFEHSNWQVWTREAWASKHPEVAP